MQSSSERPALIVFGKNPVPGKVKTRLAKSIGNDPAARLYKAFLLDSLRAFGSLDLDLWLYLAPSDIAIDQELYSLYPDYRFQSGDGLGERMSNAFGELFEMGYSKVGIVGSDLPTLPVRFIERGLAMVNYDTAVLGPAEDGGYYFVALGRLEPVVFSGIQYGRPDVFDATMRQAESAGLEVTLLEKWYDVDTIGNLQRLTQDLSSDLSQDAVAGVETRITMKHLGIL